MKNCLNRKQLIIGGAIFLAMLLGIVVYFACVVADEEVVPVYGSVTEAVCSVSEGESYTQGFTATENNATKVTVRMSFEDGKPESGEIILAVKDESGTVVGENIVDVSTIRAASALAVAFDMEKQSKGKAYEVVLSTRGIGEETPVSLMGEAPNAFLSVSYVRYRHPVYFLVIMLVVAVGLLPALVVGKNKKGDNAGE